jgi:hypothetical protein
MIFLFGRYRHAFFLLGSRQSFFQVFPKAMEGGLEEQTVSELDQNRARVLFSAQNLGTSKAKKRPLVTEGV